jgi:hypothetical protein
MVEAILWTVGSLVALLAVLVGRARQVRSAVAILIIAGALVSSIAAWRVTPGAADLRVMCAGLALARAGQPELAHTPRKGFLHPVTYPLLSVIAVDPLCRAGNAYIAVWLLILAACLLLLRRMFQTFDWLLAVVLMIAAFRASTWIVWSGNIAVVELLLVFGAVTLMQESRFVPAGILLGLAGFLRVVPLGFAALAIAASGARSFAATCLIALATFAALHISFLLLMPDASAAYWNGFATGFGGLLEREIVLGSIAHPSLLSAAQALTAWVTPERSVAFSLFVAIVGVLSLLLVRASPAGRSNLFWGGLVLLILAVPRLKPYTFGLTIPAAYAALAHRTPATQIGGLIAFCALPFAGWAAASALEPSPGVFGYTALVSLLGLYALLVLPRAAQHG